jgi:hypothetical protein
MATLTGGCACGAIRYEFSGDAMFMAQCHCRDCQRASGGPFGAAIGVPQAALKVTGQVKYHEVVADSGKKLRRGFCGTCGSPLLGRPERNPDMAVIAVGSLDDPSIFKPGMDIFTSSAQPWDQLSPATAKFPKMPQ